MIRIEKHIPAPHGLAKALLARMPKLELPFSDRSKSRFRAVLSNGAEAALFLTRGTVLRGGDAVTAEDGSLIAVVAAPEKVLVITDQDRLVLMRAAYHLGNRHTPVEVGENHLKIEHDPVLADMLRQLGTHVVEQMTTFEPEAGAYVSRLGGGHKHGHDETFDEDYALAQAAYRSHAPAALDTHAHVHHGHEHKHEHGPDCGHHDDHGHSHK